MPRIDYEQPVVPRRGRAERDGGLVAVSLAALVLAGALVAGFLLLSEPAAGPREQDTVSAAVQRSSAPTTTTRPAPTTTTGRPVVVAPPVMSTVTSRVVLPPSPPPAPDPSTRVPSDRSEQPFAVVGQPCPRRGEIGMTDRYRPVVCRGGTWRPAF